MINGLLGRKVTKLKSNLQDEYKDLAIGNQNNTKTPYSVKNSINTKCTDKIFYIEKVPKSKR